MDNLIGEDRYGHLLLASARCLVSVQMNNVPLLSALRPCFVILCASAAPLCATEGKSQKEAEAAAVKRFPELGIEGSVFRQTYLERIAKYKRETPNRLEQSGWQLALAEEVAASLTGNARDALKITRERVSSESENAGGESFLIKVRNLGSTRPVDADLKITYADQSESVERKRIPPASEITYPFGTEGKAASNVQIAAAKFPEKPPLPAAPKKEAKQLDGEWGVPVPGKPGYVTSPFAPNAGFIDVRGFPPGTVIKDPYTGKTFKIP